MTKIKLRNRYVSIRFSLASIFTLIVLTTSLCISAIFFISMRKTMREDIITRIHDIVSIGVNQIDVDMHASLTKPEHESGKSYKTVQKSLQKLRDSGTDIRYVYTMRRIKEKKYMFVVDAEEGESHFGDIYDESDLEDAFHEKNRIWIRGDFSVDQWGMWMSGFGHLYTKSGIFDGILGIDISASSIIKRERAVFLKIIIFASFVTVVFILAGLMLARRISRPLSILEQDMLKIKELKIDSDVVINTIFKEVNNMKTAEDSMKAGLRSFKKYIPADLVNLLIQKNIEATLGGEERELTIFFSDIADFTSISEAVGPDKIAEYMKVYFEGLTKIIIKHNGTIDKFIGDSIMAFWGAPHEMNDHCLQACHATLECLEFAVKLNSELTRNNKPALKTRFGINTGNVVVGNFGYEERLDYTVFGDSVNLASRLEGLNSHYGTSILISQYSQKYINNRFLTRKLDLVAVKGKKDGVFIYELLGEKAVSDDTILKFISLYETAFEYHLAKQWDKAIEVLLLARQLKPSDMPVSILINRCEEFLKNPPPDNWNGIVVFREK